MHSTRGSPAGLGVPSSWKTSPENHAWQFILGSISLRILPLVHRFGCGTLSSRFVLQPPCPHTSPRQLHEEAPSTLIYSSNPARGRDEINWEPGTSPPRKKGSNRAVHTFLVFALSPPSLSSEDKNKTHSKSNTAHPPLPTHQNTRHETLGHGIIVLNKGKKL